MCVSFRWQDKNKSRHKLGYGKFAFLPQFGYQNDNSSMLVVASNFDTRA